MADFTISLQAIKGNVTATPLAHRFEKTQRIAHHDGWHTLEGFKGKASDKPRITTEVTFEDARSAISSSDTPNIHFDYAVNPYRGCEHGCVYCCARPTHSELNLSPGLDFETRLIAKRNIAAAPRADLGKRSYVSRIINTGSPTDGYQPVERELRLTRALIELMQELCHPFSLVTKSAGVERDLDLLASLATNKLVAVYVTITTLDAELAHSWSHAPHHRTAGCAASGRWLQQVCR